MGRERLPMQPIPSSANRRWQAIGGIAIATVSLAVTAGAFLLYHDVGEYLTPNATIAVTLAALVSAGLVVLGSILASTARQEGLLAKQTAEVQKAVDLARKNPEMTMVELLAALREDQKRDARRAYWQGVGQNSAFFTLGVIVPYILTKLPK
jgi:hypothetical protein